MFHVKHRSTNQSDEQRGDAATSRTSRRQPSCASESCRSESLGGAAPTRNGEKPAFAEPLMGEGSLCALALRPRAAQGHVLAMNGIGPSRCALSALPSSHPSRASAPRTSFPPRHLSSLDLLKPIEPLRATGVGTVTGFSRDRPHPRPASPPERRKPNVGQREEWRGTRGRSHQSSRVVARGRDGPKEMGATERGSGAASKKQARFPHRHSTRAATFFATPKRLRASSSGNPSTYMTSASPTPVATTPNRYMGRYSPSSAIVVNGMV